MKPHVHQGFIGRYGAADLGIGARLKSLVELLQGRGELGDVVDQPVVFGGFPDVVCFGIGLEIRSEFA